MATRGKGNGRAKSSDAISLLKQDHEKVRGMLSELEETTERAGKKRAKLLADIKREIEVHTRVEEEIFYPAFQEAVRSKEDRKLALEAYEEHHVVDTVMAELEALPVDDETWGAKATVMKENVEHHMEEEEGEMFQKARQVFDKDELEELGSRMEQRKTEAQQDLQVPAGR